MAIKAIEPSQYEGIAAFLEDRREGSDGSGFIESINYAQNKTVIDQLQNVTTYLERFGIAVVLLFATASILISFNTVRLAIYTAREEISVKRLVGASNMYIQGPFVVEGMFYGLISAVVALILFFPLAFSLRSAAETTFGADIFSYYLSHFGLFLFVLIGSGIILGALSSFLAVRKYLSV